MRNDGWLMVTLSLLLLFAYRPLLGMSHIASEMDYVCLRHEDVPTKSRHQYVPYSIDVCTCTYIYIYI